MQAGGPRGRAGPGQAGPGGAGGAAAPPPALRRDNSSRNVNKCVNKGREDRQLNCHEIKDPKKGSALARFFLPPFIPFVFYKKKLLIFFFFFTPSHSLSLINA